MKSTLHLKGPAALTGSGRRPRRAARFSAPRPNLRLACALLFLSTVCMFAARVVHVPRAVQQLFGLPGLIGLPAPVLSRVTVFVAALALLTVAYVYAVYSVRLSRVSGLGRIVVGFTALLTAPALINPDLFSHDVYLYMFYGRMVNVHGLNPYVTLPSAVSGDAFLAYVDWRNVTSSYGPLWTSWSAMVDLLAPGGVAAHVVAFKFAGALTHLVNTCLIGLLVRRASPRNVPLAMAAYGWNPLTITEFAGNAHNESFMLLLVLSALLAYYRRRPMLGVLLLTAAIAVKFSAALLLPLYIVALLRGCQSRGERARVLLQAAGVMGAVWLMSWAPYIGDGGWRRMFALPQQSAWYLNSLPAAVYAGLRDFFAGWPWGLAPVRAGDVAATLVSLLGLAVIAGAGWKLSHGMKRRTDLVEMWFWFVFAYLFFAGSHFWPWYATTLVLLAAMSRGRYVWLVTTVFSSSAMLVYSCSDCRTYVNTSDSPLTGLAIFLLPLLTLAALWLRDNAHKPAPELETVARYG